VRDGTHSCTAEAAKRAGQQGAPTRRAAQRRQPQFVERRREHLRDALAQQTSGPSRVAGAGAGDIARRQRLDEPHQEGAGDVERRVEEVVVRQLAAKAALLDLRRELRAQIHFDRDRLGQRFGERVARHDQIDAERRTAVHAG
jgi:hypothetical protein